MLYQDPDPGRQRRREMLQARLRQPASGVDSSASTGVIPATPTDNGQPKDRKYIPGVGPARELLRGFSLSLSPRVEAALRPKATYADVKEEMRQYREDYPVRSYGSEFAGGMIPTVLSTVATGLSGGAAAPVTATSAVRQARTLEELRRQLTRAPVASRVGNVLRRGSVQGAIAGAAESEGGPSEAALGTAIGAAIPAVLQGALRAPSRIPVVRNIPSGIGSAYRGLTRSIADVLENRGARRFAENIEPSDAVRATRLSERMLPGSLRGTTSREAIRESREATAREIEDVMEIARAETEDVLRPMRRRRGGVAIEEMQGSIRRQQLEAGEASYGLVRNIGAPPKPDDSLYQEILNDNDLRNAYAAAVEIVKSRSEGRIPNLVPVRLGDNIERVPEIDLEIIDLMKREIVDKARTKADRTGVSRSRAARLFSNIDDIEDRFLGGYESGDARDALVIARQEYREYWKQLEALRDGLSLASSRAGRSGQLLSQSPQQIDVLVERVRNMGPDERNAFQIGAIESFENLRRDSPGSIDRFLNKFKSETGRQKLDLMFGQGAASSIFEPTERAVARVADIEQLAGARNVELESLGRALGGSGSGQEFLSNLGNPRGFRKLSEQLGRGPLESVEQERDILGSMITNTFYDAISQNKDPAKVLDNILAVQTNPAVRALMAVEIDNLYRKMAAGTIGEALPRAAGQSLGVALSRRASPFFSRNDENR